MDRDTAERLLDGRVAPDDAPPGYGLVARLVGVLRVAGASDPVLFPGPGRARAAAAAAGTRLPRGRVVVLTGVLGSSVLFGLTGAGALPAPAQRLAATVLDQVGVHLPVLDTADRAGATAKGTDDHDAAGSFTAANALGGPEGHRERAAGDGLAHKQ